MRSAALLLAGVAMAFMLQHAQAAPAAAVMPPAGVTWGDTAWKKIGPPGYFYSGFKSETEYGDPKAHVDPPNPAPLTPAWLERWRKIRKDAFGGANTFNVSSNCTPFGLTFTLTSGGFEMLFTPGRLTILHGGQGGLRRIYMDGRKLPEKILEPQFNGYSVGHWEGKTLVVETIGLRTDTIIEPGMPHSDKLKVIERWTETRPGHIENEVTLIDPVAFTGPWKRTWIYERMPKDEEQFEFLDFTCENNRSFMVDGKVVMIGPDGKPLTGGD